MNTPFKKRANPLAQTVTQQTVETKPAPQPTYVAPEPQPVVQPVVQPAAQQPVYSAPQPTYRPVNQKTMMQVDQSREKYTATMDKGVRRRVKIACANTGVQFSQYIEEAGIEKMRKEGF